MSKEKIKELHQVIADLRAENEKLHYDALKKSDEKGVFITETDETWNMKTCRVTNTELIGILAIFRDNVRYRRLYEIEEYIKKQELNSKPPIK